MSSGSELLEKIKDEYCDKCELSLRCMMGREIDRPIYCATCQGIVLEEGITVQCTCFSQISLGVDQAVEAIPFPGKGVRMVHNCAACQITGGGRIIRGFCEGRER